MSQSAILTAIFICFATSACARFGTPLVEALDGGGFRQLPGEGGEVIPKPDQKLPNDLPLPICSDLSFKGVTWPVDFNLDDRTFMALALNISGSYEGYHGWANLTNNFDGQGISMGLLQQNLGQGSLQPLFIKMRDNHRDVLKKYMSAAMLKTFEDMLAKWEQANQLIPHEILESTSEPVMVEKELVDFGKMESATGIEKLYAVITPFALDPHNQAGVDWAKRTVFKKDGKTFKPEWQKALKSIAGHPTYVSLQIAAARELHDRAYGYQQRLGFTELRGYLFLFDIAVQNGTLKEKHFDQFFAWRANNPSAPEETQMLELLEIRVVDSKPQWQEDVRKRKTATIKGFGEVHGRDRDLQDEFCYDQHEYYPN